MVGEAQQYNILEAVGQGGFGTVYKAEMVGESGFSKTVALKVLNASMLSRPEVGERLRDEARLLALVSHRAIVQVHGLVTIGERWAVVMEFVDGVDLGLLLAQSGPIPPGVALEIIGEVAGALHVAYHQEVQGSPLRLLHRDIKPSNIQITTHGEVKILDFGVARADFSHREAKTQALRFGSQAYMSPERLDFIDSAAGDVYALAVVLSELCTGKRFGKTSSNEDRHKARLYDNLDQLWKSQGKEMEPLVRLVETMASYDPEDRPLAREVERRCAEVRRVIGGELLRDWAETAVPPVKGKQKISPELVEADLEGATLLFGSSSNNDLLARMDSAEDVDSLELGEPLTQWSPPTASSAFEPEMDLGKRSERKPPRFQGLAIGIILLLGTVCFSGFWWATQRPQTPASEVGPRIERATTPVAESAGEASEETPEAEEPVASAEEALVPEPTEEVEATPTTPVPDKPARTRTRRSATGSAAVTVSGDAVRVELVSGSTRHRIPGTVPSGSYDVEADFGSGEPSPAGRVTISANTPNAIHCDGTFGLCNKR
jgi:serine/threonine-protein kinase